MLVTTVLYLNSLENENVLNWNTPNERKYRQVRCLYRIKKEKGEGIVEFIYLSRNMKEFLKMKNLIFCELHSDKIKRVGITGNILRRTRWWIYGV